jgi:signal transduction histidine kinase
VVKHAKATIVQIQLNYNQDSISLAVIDDGLGFDPENISLSGGLGLQGIQERVQKSGGHLEIESSWGKGTRLVVTIPIYTRDPNEKNEITRR